LINPRAEIKNISAPIHGGIDPKELSELNLNLEDIIDFSSNINPFVESGEILKKAQTKIDIYPDTSCYRLKKVISEIYDLNPENIIVGNGSTEVIYLICQAYMNGKDRVIIPSPTFSEYERASKIMGAEPVFYVLKEEDGFRIDANKLIEFLRTRNHKIAFLCNPNNPTGRYLRERELKEILEENKNTLFVLDEAYLDFVKDPWDSTGFLKCKNLLILRSLTKSHGLPGLRIGYALSSNEIISNLEKVRPPWNVNSIAQEAGILALLNNRDYLSKARQGILMVKDYLLREIEKMGKKCIPSETGFFMVKVDNARRLRISLLRRGILVRDCTSFGLPNFIRLSARPIHECEKLIREWKQLDSTEGSK
jgi:histidinol-phosphate aminotransferase